MSGNVLLVVRHEKLILGIIGEVPYKRILEGLF